METTESNKNGKGMVAGIIACVMAVLGILFLGFVFVPIAVVIAIFGTYIAIKNKNMSGIGVNILAWVLIIVGFVTSPALLLMIGLTSSQVSSGGDTPFVNRATSTLADQKTGLEKKVPPTKIAPQKSFSEYVALISGTWTGEYVCMQNVTGVTLNISSIQNGALEATFNFYPTKANPKVKEGAFSMKGSLGENGSFSLSPRSWIKKPASYSMVKVDGQLDATNNSISGKIIYSGCSTISLSKK